MSPQDIVLKRWGKMLLGIFFSLIFFGLIFFVTFASFLVDKNMNAVEPHEEYYVTARAESLHKNMIIMDWHSDTLLWDRSLLTRNDYGHVDMPRLMEGNVSFQMFTTVTKSPSGQNLHENSDASDRITPLIIAQLWPPKTWNSLLERALYQAKKLSQFAEASDGEIVFIKNRRQFTKVLEARSRGKAILGALLGTEGAHTLEGKLSNIDKMYKAGFRMMGITHFFDNELGGSLHGTKKGGLTKFGHKAVRRMIRKNMIIDLAHASEAVVRDVLAIPDAAVVVSHTGLRGTCDSPRNLPDDLIKQIAAKGGIIGIGFWDKAVCDVSPIGIAKTILYGIELVGADHIALGSDWDGTITAAITPDELQIITQILMTAGVPAADISKIMGMNSVNFLMQNLPD